MVDLYLEFCHLEAGGGGDGGGNSRDTGEDSSAANHGDNGDTDQDNNDSDHGGQEDNVHDADNNNQDGADPGDDTGKEVVNHSDCQADPSGFLFLVSNLMRKQGAAKQM